MKAVQTKNEERDPEQQRSLILLQVLTKKRDSGATSTSLRQRGYHFYFDLGRSQFSSQSLVCQIYPGHL